jgi:predicted RNA-binding protein with PIN domain
MLLAAIISPYFPGGAAISSIIIDGYNLIGIQHGDLQKKREALIQRLIEYKKLKGHDITVVFDGWKSGGHREERTVTGGIAVIYSRLAEKADSVIKKIISSGNKDWIVVTSDRDIMAHAWSCGSVPVPSERFMERLEQGICHSGHNTRDDSGADDEEDEETSRAGSPRRLSKKDKALLRALGKL